MNRLAACQLHRWFIRIVSGIENDNLIAHCYDSLNRIEQCFSGARGDCHFSFGVGIAAVVVLYLVSNLLP